MVDSLAGRAVETINQMVESRSDHLDHVFQALAHPVRRAILRRIATSEHSVTELATPFDMSLEAVSKHIQVLERARLLRRTRAGRVHRCKLSPRPLRDAAKVLTELSSLWHRRLDALEKLLVELERQV
jgi:DNA-binding transcriptional ArsR family regulator